MTLAAPKPAILCVGRLYCDLIFTDLPRMPSLGTEVFTEGFGTHAGGGAFITAAHLAALGHPSSLSAMLPSSPFSDLMRGEIEASRVDLSLSASLPASAGPQVTVAMVTGGDRAFLTRRAGPAFPALNASDLSKRGIQHIHVGELASLVAHPEVLALAKTIGATLSVDCSWDDELAANTLRPILPEVDVFLPNESEMSHLQELGIAAEELVPLTVVKRGSSGASAICRDGPFAAPTKPIKAVDTTGAGDAFNAGFLSSWLGGANVADALAAGNARGALSVRTRGGYVPEALS